METPWKNRIVGYGDEPIDQVQFNPKNWRIHPQAQQDALNGVLREVGWVQNVIVNKRTGHLVDGHARVMLADRNGEQTIPVTYVDLSEEEEALILASIDPIAALAATDKQKLEDLMHECHTGEAGLQAMLSELAEKEKLAFAEMADGKPSGIDDTYTSKIVAPVYEPKGDCPPIGDLFDRDKTETLIGEIESALLPEDVSRFLKLAAERHTVFNFRQIAEFYCHADAKIQDLMERSGLVIIDFKKAIEYGFVHLTEQLGALADQEEADRA